MPVVVRFLKHGSSTFLSAGLLLLCRLCALNAFGQDDPKDLTLIPLEELNSMEVYSASKFSQKVSEAPASISIMTAAEIRHYGYRTFAEVLNSITGFYVTNDRNYEYAGVRGFGRTGDYNTRVLILLNGLRLNDNIYGSTAIGTDFPVNIDLIERIEVVRGPASSLYGTNAFFGTINVITKRGGSIEGGQISAEAGSWHTFKGTASYGTKFANGAEMLVSAAYRGSKGPRRLYFTEFDAPETNDGIAQDLDTGSNASVYVNTSFRDFAVQFSYNKRDKGIPTASYGTAFNDRAAKTTDRTSYLDLKFERSFSKNWNILSRTYLGMYGYEGIYGYNNSDEGTDYFTRNLDYSSGHWWGGELQFTRNIAGRHHLTVGSEWQYSYNTSQSNHDVAPEYHSYLNTDNPWATGGAYLQGEFGLRPNLLVSAGVRHDEYTTFGGNTSPRIGLVYSPLSETTVKVLYGHAFRAPNSYELHYEDGYSAKTNPKLEPEKIKTLEFVLDQYIGRRFRIGASAYHYHVNGLIVQELDETDQLSYFLNSGNVHAKGLEIEFEAKDFNGIDGRVSYTLQRAENHQNGLSLPNSPRHIAQLNLFLPCFSVNGGAGLELRYMGARKTSTEGRVGGFLLTNVTLLYKKLLPGVDLTAGIYNAFDKRYSDPAGTEHIQDSIFQNGRSFRVRLDFSISAK